MTSTTNARELGRLRKARGDAQQRFARQMRLLEQIEATAGDLERVTVRWRAQLAALAELAGSPGAAADLSGLSKSDIEAAVRGVEKDAVRAAVQAAEPPARRRRPPATPTASGGTGGG